MTKPTYYFNRFNNLFNGLAIFGFLLCAGNKSTQSKDIDRAIKYWQEYLHND